MRTIRIIAANVILSALVLAAASALLAADRLWPFRLPKELALFTWPLLAAGLLLIAFAMTTFVRMGRATGTPGNPPIQLVTAGPFRFIRNPIYLGAALVLAAITFYRQSPSFLLVVVSFIIGVNLYVRQVEEPRLEMRFGEAYVRYKQSVPRWIPSQLLLTRIARMNRR